MTGKGKYYGTVTKTFKINPKAITPSVALTKTNFTYSGEVIKPGADVKDGATKLTAADYTVTCCSNCKNVGPQKVTVKLKGNYSGPDTVLSFKINPKGTTLKSLTGTSKGATVKWTKQDTKMSTAYITGYKIQLATDSAFTKNVKNVTVSGYSRVGKSVTGLAGAKKYYVRIRTYKTISDVIYYSGWSSAMTVTTKQ